MSKLNFLLMMLLASNALVALSAVADHSRSRVRQRLLSRGRVSSTSRFAPEESSAETAFLDCAADHLKLEDSPSACKDICYDKCYGQNSQLIRREYPRFDLDKYLQGMLKLLTETNCELKTFSNPTPITPANLTGDAEKTALKGKLAAQTFVNGVPHGASWADSGPETRAGHAAYRITVQIGNAVATSRSDALFDVLIAVLKTIQPAPVWFKFFTPHEERADTMIFMFKVPVSEMSGIFTKVQNLVSDMKEKRHIPIGKHLPPFQFTGTGAHKDLASVADYQGGESFGYKLCTSVCHVGQAIRGDMQKAALAKATEDRNAKIDKDVHDEMAKTDLIQAVTDAQAALDKASNEAQTGSSPQTTNTDRNVLKAKKALARAKVNLKQHEMQVRDTIERATPAVGSPQVDNAALSAKTKTIFKQKWQAGHNSMSSAWTFADPTWPRITKQGGEREYTWS